MAGQHGPPGSSACRPRKAGSAKTAGKTARTSVSARAAAVIPPHHEEAGGNVGAPRSAWPTAPSTASGPPGRAGRRAARLAAWLSSGGVALAGLQHLPTGAACVWELTDKRYIVLKTPHAQVCLNINLICTCKLRNIFYAIN